MTTPPNHEGLDLAELERVAKAVVSAIDEDPANWREEDAFANAITPAVILSLVAQIRALRDVAQTGRDYAKDMADGHLVSVKIDGRSTTVTEYRQMGADDLARFDAALAREVIR